MYYLEIKYFLLKCFYLCIIDKTKLHPTTVIKNQNLKHSSYTRYHTNSNQTIIATDMFV